MIFNYQIILTRRQRRSRSVYKLLLTTPSFVETKLKNFGNGFTFKLVIVAQRKQTGTESPYHRAEIFNAG